MRTRICICMHKLSKHFIVRDQARLHANAHSLACPSAADRSKFFQSLGPGSRRTVRTSMVVSWTAVVGRGNNQNKYTRSSTNLKNTKSFSRIQLFRQRSCMRFLAFRRLVDPLASLGRAMLTAVLSRQKWTRCLHKLGMDAHAKTFSYLRMYFVLVVLARDAWDNACKTGACEQASVNNPQQKAHIHLLPPCCKGRALRYLRCWLLHRCLCAASWDTLGRGLPHCISRY